MNTQQRAAMQMALEALESAPVQYDFNSYPMLVMTPDTLQTTLTALREALVEQAEQEPVAWVNKERTRSIEWLKIAPEHGTKLYSHPVRTKDLTDDEIRAIRFNWERNEFAIDFARAVIAADREKNK